MRGIPGSDDDLMVQTFHSIPFVPFKHHLQSAPESARPSTWLRAGLSHGAI